MANPAKVDNLAKVAPYLYQQWIKLVKITLDEGFNGADTARILRVDRSVITRLIKKEGWIIIKHKQ